MAMTRARKAEEVEAYKKRFEESEGVIVTHNLGLTVEQITNLRSELRKEGASFKITKNSLAKRALQGTNYEQLADMFTGPVGVATSQDPASAAKVISKFAKTNDRLAIVGAGLGVHVLDAEGVQQLAKLPSLDELRGKLVGLIQAPAQKIAGVVSAPAGQLARVVGAYAAKDN